AVTDLRVLPFAAILSPRQGHRTVRSDHADRAGEIAPGVVTTVADLGLGSFALSGSRATRRHLHPGAPDHTAVSPQPERNNIGHTVPDLRTAVAVGTRGGDCLGCVVSSSGDENHLSGGGANLNGAGAGAAQIVASVSDAGGGEFLPTSSGHQDIPRSGR